MTLRCLAVRDVKNPGVFEPVPVKYGVRLVINAVVWVTLFTVVLTVLCSVLCKFDIVNKKIKIP